MEDVKRSIRVFKKLLRTGIVTTKIIGEPVLTDEGFSYQMQLDVVKTYQKRWSIKRRKKDYHVNRKKS